MTKDILFNNSNLLYNLRYETVFDDYATPPKALAYNIKPVVESQGQPTGIPITPIPDMRGQPPTVPPQPAYPGAPSTEVEPPPFPPPPREPQVYDVQLFDMFMQQNSEIKFVYVQWLDYMATMRVRIVPIKEFDRMMRSGSRIGISQGNTGTLQNDSSTPVMNPIGQIYVEPDLRTLRRTHKRDPIPSATVMSFWRGENGIPIRECPRANMELLINDLQYNHGSKLPPRNDVCRPLLTEL